MGLQLAAALGLGFGALAKLVGAGMRSTLDYLGQTLEHFFIHQWSHHETMHKKH